MDLFEEMKDDEITQLVPVGNMSGVLASTSVDSVGDQLTVDHLTLILNKHEDNPFLYDGHDMSNPPIGKITKMEIKEIKPGIYGLIGHIDVYYDKVIEEVKSGQKAAFSISTKGEWNG